METITIKIKGKDNLEFIIKLLKKFNFVVLDKEEKKGSIRDSGKLPIDWSKSKPDINDFNDVWNGRKLDLQEIRANAWKRS